MKSGYDNYFKQVKKSSSKAKGPSKASNKKAKAKPKKATTTQSVEELLRKELKVRKQKKQGAGHGAQILLVSGAMVFLLTGFVFLDDIVHIVNKIEVSWLGQATAADKNKQENTTSSKEVKEEKNATAKNTAKTQESKNKETWTTEDISYFSKLNERKKELDLREQELNELEEELHKQKKEIEDRIATLKTIRNSISGTLKEKVEIDEAKVDKLVGVYSNMKPQQAAQVIESINEDLAVEVLGRMKKKNAAAILNLLKSNKARTLSEKYAGYKRR